MKSLNLENQNTQNTHGGNMMVKNELNDMIVKLQLDKNIKLQDIPEIDLYMDQVIQLFENSFGDTLRNKDEKVLTKTMINNYAKDKLLMPIKNKKYSKEHIILLSIIYQLKGSLSINDIKKLLTPIINSFNDDDSKNSFSLRDFYDSYLSLVKKNSDEFESEISKKLEDVNSNIPKDNCPHEEYLSTLLLILSFVNMSNNYRKAAEKLIDNLK